MCRDRRELLSTAPVVLSALLSRAFVHGFVCEQREQTVQFLAENELLPPDLLCYRILDTIASICYEYGDATPVRLQVQLNAAIDGLLSCVLSTGVWQWHHNLQRHEATLHPVLQLQQ